MIETKEVAISTSCALTDPADQQVRETALASISESKRIPQFSEGLPVAAEEGEDPLLPFAVLMSITHAKDPNVAVQVVHTAASGQLYEDRDHEMTMSARRLADLAPQSAVEAMLCAQMVALDRALTKCMNRANSPKASPERMAENLNLATKLQRTFISQVETLQKLRRKGEQTVRVEHVTVAAGGQAIIGDVHHPGGAGGCK